MAGYLIRHFAHTSDGITADYFRNDPYVWHSPYLWSFCHLNQHPRIITGMTVLWLSNTHADRAFRCDLVFVVADVIPFSAARALFAPQDADLAWHHFERGVESHPEVLRPTAKTYVADMQRSYIPTPPVPIHDAVDLIRHRERSAAKPLSVAWGRRTTPLRIGAMPELEGTVAARAERRIVGPLDASWSSPGQKDKLR